MGTRSSEIAAAATIATAAVALLLTGSIAGFFYAYSSSVMRGLNAVAPEHAITAMQGINATVRNAVFAPAFFGTPVATTLAGIFLFVGRHKAAGLAMLLAAVIYILGAFWPTFAVNVPMNNALAGIDATTIGQDAAGLWSAYSNRWTWWNTFRTAASLTSLIFVGLAIFLYGRRPAA